MSDVSIIKARLGRLKHVVPGGYTATVTTLDGEPAIQLTNSRTGEVVGVHPARQYLAKLAGGDARAAYRTMLKPQRRSRELTPRGKMTAWGAQ